MRQVPLAVQLITYISDSCSREPFATEVGGCFKYMRKPGNISINILLRRVEFGIWLKHHRKIWNFTRRSRVKFQIFLWCLKAKFQIPLSAEGCLWLTPRHLFINWKICGIWAKFSQILKNLWEFEIWAKFSQILTNLWEFGSNSTDFEWWFRVESGIIHKKWWKQPKVSLKYT